MFSKEGECVCAGEWEKHGRYFFLFGFLREKGVAGVTCFVTFLFVFGGL
jgi:hypothetical protein